MEAELLTWDLGSLLGLYLQSFVVQVTMLALSVVIFVIVYGRMIEIYLSASLAPIPMSTFGSREQSQVGQNYLRSLFALGFQGFLIMICVGIYAVLVLHGTSGVHAVQDRQHRKGRSVRALRHGPADRKRKIGGSPLAAGKGGQTDWLRIFRSPATLRG